MRNKWTEGRNQRSLELIYLDLMVTINYDYSRKEVLKFAQEEKTAWFCSISGQIHMG
jgi:hypothetical protein